jgi:hypothetical protein
VRDRRQSDWLRYIGCQVVLELQSEGDRPPVLLSKHLCDKDDSRLATPVVRRAFAGALATRRYPKLGRPAVGSHQIILMFQEIFTGMSGPATGGD